MLSDEFLDELLEIYRVAVHSNRRIAEQILSAMAEIGVIKRWNEDANNSLPFGLCKEYGIELPDDAEPYDVWMALHEATGKEPDYFYAQLGRKEEADDEPEREQLWLPKKEYGRVMHEIASHHYGKLEGKSSYYVMSGSHFYLFDIVGFGEYIIYDKVKSIDAVPPRRKG